MLTPETPFPNVGSYALLIDEDQPLGQQRAELVRIHSLRLVREGHGHPIEKKATLAFPLREGASGNKTVPFAGLIDATPLTGAEAREMVDLDSELRGLKVRDRANKQARHDALYSRATWAPHMQRLLDEAHNREAKRRAA